MLFKHMKKLEKIVFYEFNISFALILHEWKMVLDNLTLIHIYYMILHLNCISYFPKML